MNIEKAIQLYRDQGRSLQRAISKYALDASAAREAALQALLTAADQRVDELETKLRALRNPRKAA